MYIVRGNIDLNGSKIAPKHGFTGFFVQNLVHALVPCAFLIKSSRSGFVNKPRIKQSDLWQTQKSGISTCGEPIFRRISQVYSYYHGTPVNFYEILVAKEMLFGCVYHFFARNMQSLPLPYCLNLCNMIDCSANTPGMFYLNFGRGTKTICKENHSNSYGGNKKQIGIAHNKRHEFAKQENRHADQHAPPVAPFPLYATL